MVARATSTNKTYKKTFKLSSEVLTISNHFACVFRIMDAFYSWTSNFNTRYRLVPRTVGSPTHFNSSPTCKTCVLHSFMLNPLTHGSECSRRSQWNGSTKRTIHSIKEFTIAIIEHFPSNTRWTVRQSTPMTAQSTLTLFSFGVLFGC